MVFHWSSIIIIMSDSKSPHVSRTLLGILVDLNNALVCIVRVQKNDDYHIKIITWNYMTLNVRLEYLKPYTCVQIICVR